MRKTIIAILMAISLIFAVGVPANAAPAPAGWTGNICTNVVNHNITAPIRICTKAYIDGASRMDYLQVCTSTQDNGYYWPVNQIKDGTVTAGGQTKSLIDQNPVTCKTNTFALGIPVTLRGSYVAKGTIDIQLHPDQQWYLCGRFDSGSYC